MNEIEDKLGGANCNCRILGDQYVCDRCQICWDIDDPDPPDCSATSQESTPEKGHEFDEVYEVLKK